METKRRISVVITTVILILFILLLGLIFLFTTNARQGKTKQSDIDDSLAMLIASTVADSNKAETTKTFILDSLTDEINAENYLYAAFTDNYRLELNLDVGGDGDWSFVDNTLTYAKDESTITVVVTDDVELAISEDGTPKLVVRYLPEVSKLNKSMDTEKEFNNAEMTAIIKSITVSGDNLDTNALTVSVDTLGTKKVTSVPYSSISSELATKLAGVTSVNFTFDDLIDDEQTVLTFESNSSVKYYLSLGELVVFTDSSHIISAPVDSSELFSAESWREVEFFTLNNFYTKDVTNTTSMFSSLSNLKAIFVNKSAVKLNKVEIGTNMFAGCSSLRGYYVENDNLKFYLFDGNNVGLSRALIAAKNKTGYFTDVKSNITSENVDQLLTYEVCATTLGDMSVIFADEDSQAFISTITDVFVGGTKADYSISSSTTGEDVSIVASDSSVNGVGKIKLYTFGTIAYIIHDDSDGIIYANPSCKDLFDGFTNLKYVTFKNFDISKVTTFEGMFAGLTNLKAIFVPDGTDWSENEAISTDMFDGCENLAGHYTVGENGLATYSYNTDNTNDITFAKIASSSVNGYFTLIPVTNQITWNQEAGYGWTYGENNLAAPVATAAFGEAVCTYYKVIVEDGQEQEEEIDLAEIATWGAGNYVAKASVAQDPYLRWYGLSDSSFSFTISPKPVAQPVVEQYIFTYNGREITFFTIPENAEYELTNDSDELTQTYVNDNGYTIKIALLNENYVWQNASAGHETDILEYVFTINKAIYDMTNVSFGNASYVYDGESERTLSISSESLPDGVGVTYSYRLNNEETETTSITDVGTLEITAHFTGDSSNYELIDDKVAVITITPRSVTLTTYAYTFYESQSMPAIELSAGDVLEDDVSAVSCVVDTDIQPMPAEVNTYNNVVVKLVGNRAWNYTLGENNKITITINSVGAIPYTPPTATLLTYTGSAQNLLEAGSCSYGTITYSLDEGDNKTWSENIPQGTNAGTYTVYYRVTPSIDYAAQYTEVSTSVNVTIGPKSCDEDMANVNVVISKEYNGEPQYVDINNLPGYLTSSVTYTQNNEEIQNPLNAGVYGVNIIFAPTSNNYIAPNDYNGEFTITPKIIYLANSSYSYSEGESLPTIGLTGVLEGDVSGVSCVVDTAVQAEPTTPGVHENVVVKLTGAKAENYSLYTNTITITIKIDIPYTAPTKADLTYIENTAQTLLEAGSCSYGTISYSLDEENWSGNIPQGTNAGTYIVYYRVTPTGANASLYNEVISSVEAEIKQAEYDLIGANFYVTVPTVYNGSNQTVVINNLPATLTTTVVFTRTQDNQVVTPRDVDEYCVDISFESTDNNYRAPNDWIHVFSITPKIINLVTTSYEIYDDETFVFNGGLSGVIGSDEVVASVYGNVPETVGSHQLIIALVGSDALNYSLSSNEVTLTIKSSTAAANTLLAGEALSALIKGGNYDDIDNTITKIIFGSATKYSSEVNSINGEIVNLRGSDNIKLYRKNNVVYILSANDTIIANEDCKHMFSNMQALESIEFEIFDTSNVTTMQGMFNACRALATLDLSGFNFANTDNLLMIFNDCRTLEIIYVANDFALKPTANGMIMFSGCSELKGYYNVTSYNAFNSNNTSKDYAEIATSSNGAYLTSISWMGPIEEAQLMTTNTLKAGSAFNTIITGSDYSNVTEIVFANASDFDLIAQGDGVDITDSGSGQVMLYLDGTTAYVLALNNKTIYANQSCVNMFKDLENVENITFTNFNTNNTTSMYSMFYNCKKLSSLDLTNFNTDAVTNMTTMFMYCRALEVIYVDEDNWDISNVASSSNMFMSCAALKGFYYDDDVLDYYDDYFSNTAALNATCAIIPDSNTRGYLTSMDIKTSVDNVIASRLTTPNTIRGYLSSMSGLERIVFANQTSAYASLVAEVDQVNIIDITEKQSGKVKLYKAGNTAYILHEDLAGVIYANRSCSSLFQDLNTVVNIDFNNFNTLFTTDVSAMFYGCSELSRLDLSGFNMSRVYDSYYNLTFTGCSNLQVIYVSSNWDISEDSSTIFYSNTRLRGYYLVDNTLTSRPFSSVNANDYTNAVIAMQNNLGYFTAATLMDQVDLLLSEPNMVLSGSEFNALLKSSEYNGATEIIFATRSEYPEIANSEDGSDITAIGSDNVRIYKDGSTIYVLSMNNLPIYANVDSSSMFYHLYNVTNYDLSNLNTSNVTNMQYMFANSWETGALTELDLRNFDTSRVVNMGSMFENCSSLTNLDLSSFDTSSVITMDYMFSGCQSLGDVNLTTFNTSNVISMANMFTGCKNLFTLDLSSFDTSKVKDMSNMFYNAYNSDSRYYESGSWEDDDYFSFSFYADSGLTVVYIGDNWNITNLTWSDNMFDEYEYAPLAGYYEENGELKRSGYLTNIAYKDEVDAALGRMNSTLLPRLFGSYNDFDQVIFDNKANVNVDLSNAVAMNVTLVPDDKAKVHMYVVDNVAYVLHDDPDGVIYADDCSGMFNQYWNQDYFEATSIIFNNFDTSYATDMSGMFGGCSNLTELDLSGFDTSNVTDMSEMFYVCSNLINIDLSSFDTSKVTTMFNMFDYCGSLTTLDLSSFDTRNVTNMGYMFGSEFSVVYVGENWSTEKLTADYLEYAYVNATGYYINSNNELSWNTYDWNNREASMLIAKAGNGGCLTDIRIKPFVEAYLADQSPQSPNTFTGLPDIVKRNATQIIFGKKSTYENILGGVNGIDVSYLKNGIIRMYQVGSVYYILNENDDLIYFPENSYGLLSSWNDYGASNLKSIILDNIDTSQVTNMEGMFSGCNSLKSLDLSGFNTDNVTSMENMFSGCSSLVELDISSFNTSNVTNMKGMFGACSELLVIYISDLFDTSNENASINNTYYYYYMFRECYNLAGYYVSGSVASNSYDDTNVTIDYAVVANSTNGGYLTHSDNKAAVESYIASYYVNTLRNGSVFNYVTSDTTRIIFDTKENQISNVSGEGVDVSLLSDGSVKMYQMGTIAYILNENNTQTYAPADSSGLFYFYDYNGYNENILESIVFNNFNTSRTLCMSSMFAGCRELKVLDLGSFDTTNVINMGGMFYDYNSLKIRTIFVGDNWVINPNAVGSSNKGFLGDFSKLCGYYLDNSNELVANGYNITVDNKDETYAIAANASNYGRFTHVSLKNTVEAMFANTLEDSYLVTGFNSKLADANVAEIIFANANDYPTIASGDGIDVTEDKNGNIKLFVDGQIAYVLAMNNQTIYANPGCGYMFRYLKVNSIKFNNFNTLNVTSMYEMFYGCSNLVSLDLSSFNTKNVTSMYEMFSNCKALRIIYVSDAKWDISNINLSDDRWNYDNKNTFSSCSNLAGYYISGSSVLSSVGLNASARYAVIADGTNNGYLTNIADKATIASSLASTYNNVLINVLRYFIGANTTSIVFGQKQDYTSQIGVVDGVDVSYAMNGSVKLYHVGYTDYILSENNTSIYAPADSSYLFSELKNLQSITFGNFNTSRVTDMSYMFYRCSSLETIDLSSLNTGNVANMSCMFAGCSSLTNPNLSGLSTVSVTNMGSMFSSCSSLTNLNLSSLNTSNVNNMSCMFYYCSNLRYINVGNNFVTTNVTDSHLMFYRCSRLAGFYLDSNVLKGYQVNLADENCITKTYAKIATANDIGYFTNVSKATIDANIETLFANTFIPFTFNAKTTKVIFGKKETYENDIDGLEGVDISYLNDGSIMYYKKGDVYYILNENNELIYTPSSIAKLFIGLTDLEIVIFDNVDTSKTMYMDSMFSGCLRLKVIYANNDFDTTSLISCTSMFDECSALVGYYLDSSDMALNEYDTSNTTATYAVLADDQNNGYFTDIDIQNDVEAYWILNSESNILKSGNVRNLLSSKTTKLIFGIKSDYLDIVSSINGVDVSGVGDGSIKLYQLGTLAYILSENDLPIYTPVNSTKLFYTANSSSVKLKMLDLSNIDTSKTTNMSYMFYGSIVPEQISSFDTSKVTDMSYMFYKTSVDNIDFSGFDTSNVENMSYMFSNVSAVNLDLSGFNTSNVTDMSYMFSNCENLVSLDLSGFDTRKVTNMQGMFSFSSNNYYRGALKQLDLSSFDTSSVTNMSSMFNYCSNLAVIYVGSDWTNSNVTNASNTFSNCYSLAGYYKVDDEFEVVSFNSSNNTADLAKLAEEGGYLTSVTCQSDLQTELRNTIKRTLSVDRTYNIVFGKKSDYATIISGIEGVDVSLLGDDSIKLYKVGEKEGSYYDYGYVLSEDDGVIYTPDSLYQFMSSNTTIKSISFDNVNTSKTTNMTNMFSGSRYLDKIYVGSGWDLSNVSSSTNMFNDCSYLEGYYSLTQYNRYNSSYKDKTYAIVATSTNHGYLTDINLYWKFEYYPKTLIAGSSFNAKIPSSVKQIIFANASDYPSISINYFNDTNVAMMNSDIKLIIKDDIAYVLARQNNTIYANSDCSNMFSGLNVDSIIFKNFDTSFVENMDEMFADCINLKAIYIDGEWNTQNVNQSSGMFDGATSLAGYYIGSNNFVAKNTNANVNTDINNAIVATNSNSGYFTNIDNKLAAENSIQQLYTNILLAGSLSEFIDSSTTTIKIGQLKNYVNYIVSAEGVDVSFLGDGSVKLYQVGTTAYILSENNSTIYANPNSYNLFANLESLKNISFDNLNTSRVVNMSGMFANCVALTSIDLSGFDTSSVTNMSSMFSGCCNLYTIYVGPNWSNSNVTVGADMFANCSRLAGYYYESSTICYNAFTTTQTSANFAQLANNLNGGYLTSCSIKDNVRAYIQVHYSNTIINGALSDVISSSTTSIVFGQKHNYETEITGINPIDISYLNDRSVKLYQVDTTVYILSENNSAIYTPIDSSNLFSNLTNLVSITFGNLNTSRTTSFNNMFNGDSNLASLDLSGFNTAKATDMASMFKGCSKLVILDLSSFSTTALVNIANMFYGCTKLEKIFVNENWNVDNVSNSLAVFTNCSVLKGYSTSSVCAYDSNKTDYTYAKIAKLNVFGYLTDIDLRQQIEEIENNTLITGNNLKTRISNSGATIVVFDNYSKHSTFDEASGIDVTQKESGKVKLFVDGTTAYILSMDGGTIYANANSSSMFYGLNVTSITFNNFNTNNVTNMASMFYNCSKLESIDVSGFNTSSVTSMASMFYNCSMLNNIDLSSFDTSNVTTMSSMFYNCSKLITLDLIVFDTSNVTNMGSMFYNCSNLVNIYVDSTFVITKLASASSNKSSTFYGCTKLLGGYIDGNENVVINEYNSNQVTAEKAILASVGGYLTHKNDRARVESYLNSMYLNTITPTIKSSIESTIDTVIFGTKENNLDAIENIEGVDVSYLNDGSVMLYKNGTTAYILSENNSVIYTPENSANLFSSKTNLMSITFSNVDLSRTQNMSYMFSSCSKLETINLGIFNTNNVTDMSYMFSGCSSLVNVNYTLFNVANVSTMSYMFSNCSKLTNLDLSNWITTNLTNMSYMFNNCTALTMIDLSDFDTANVTNVSYMFNNCSKLNNLNLSNLNTSNVTTMAYMFYGCSSLTSLNLSSFNTSKVSNMISMFYNCGNLVTIFVDTTFVNTNASNSSSTFYGCTKLVGGYVNNNDVVLITFNSSQTTSACAKLASNGGYLTHKDDKTMVESYLALLYTNTVNNTFRSNIDNTVTSIILGHKDDYTEEVDGVSAIDVSYLGDGSVNLYQSENTAYILSENSSTIYTPSDSSSMFSGLSNVTTIVFNDVDTSRATNIGSMFANCSSLTSVNLGSLNMSAVTNSDALFNNCVELRSVNLPDNLNVIGGLAFSGCNVLGSLTLPESLTSIGVSAFTKTGFTSITIPANVTSIGSNAFQYCFSLAEVVNKSSLSITAGATSNGYVAYYALYVCPSSQASSYATRIIEIDGVYYYSYSTDYIAVGCDRTLTSLVVSDSCTSIRSSAFSQCSKLESITLPFIGSTNPTSTTASSSTLLGYIFGTTSFSSSYSVRQYYSNTSYSTYYIPSSLRTVIITGDKVLRGAFNACSSLTSVVLSGDVASIGINAFSGCSNLKSIVIPRSVTSISSGAFMTCSKLAEVYFCGTLSQWSITINNTNNSYFSNATRYYYSEEEPAESGNYWHYDTDGITPVKWE